MRVTVAVISRVVGYPIHFSDIEFPEKEVWEYFHGGNYGMVSAIKNNLHIPKDEEVFVAVYAEYLVNPLTHEIFKGNRKSDISEFVKSAFVKRASMMSGVDSEYKPKYLKQEKAFVFATNS